MSWKHIKGVITVASMAIGFASTTLLAWMGWVSMETIANGKEATSLTASVGDIPTMKQQIQVNTEALKDIQGAIKYGIFPRLQIDEKFIKAQENLIHEQASQ